jgi:hypothetical protein
MPSVLPADAQVVELSAPLSIDGGADDNDFLEKMRAHFGTTTPLHQSVERAFANISAGGQVTLISHGLAGLISAGQGDRFVPGDPKKFIAFDNGNVWEPLVQALRGRITRLDLFACNTAAGKRGAQLLNRLANLLEVPVRAPDGLVGATENTNAPYLVAGTNLLEATRERPLPERDTDLAESLQPLFTPFAADQSAMALREGDGVAAVRNDEVLTTRLRFRRIADREEVWSNTWTGDEARMSLRFVNFSAPLRFPGPLATIVTGRFFVTYLKAGQKVRREFLIHSDTLLEDVYAPGTFYRVDVPLLAAFADTIGG